MCEQPLWALGKTLKFTTTDSVLRDCATAIEVVLLCKYNESLYRLYIEFS